MIVKPLDKSLLPLNELPLLTMHQVMAERLRQYFEEESDVYVFNLLTLVRAGRRTKYDHLIVSPWGIFMMQHLYVSYALQINVQNLWTKVAKDGQVHRIDSPLDSSLKRAVVLRDLLNQKMAPKLPRKFGMRQFFGNFPIEGVLAMSDSAFIIRDIRRRGSYVVKHEAALGEVLSKMTEYRVRSELAWLLSWFQESNRVLTPQQTFDLATVLQEADQAPSNLSALLIHASVIPERDSISGELIDEY